MGEVVAFRHLMSVIAQDAEDRQLLMTATAARYIRKNRRDLDTPEIRLSLIREG